MTDRLAKERAETGIMGLLSAIKSFAATAYKEPLWLIMTFILGSSVTFLASYYSSDADEHARLEISNIELDVWMDDSYRMVGLLEQVITENEVVLRIAKKSIPAMLDIMNGQMTNSKQQIQEDYDLAVETIKRMEILTARLKGTHFRVPMYNEQASTIEAQLAHKISVLKFIENFDAAYLADDSERLSLLIRQSGSRASTLIAEAETSVAAQRSDLAQLVSTSRLKKAEYDRFVAQSEKRRKLGLLQYPFYIFLAGYVLAIFLGIRKSLKESSHVVRHQNRSQRGSKQRGNKSR